MGATVGSVVAVIAVLVALAPTILSGSFGRSIAVGFMQAYVNGSVTLAELQLSWSGPQIVRGLAITGKSGDSIALDIDAKNGLWALATGSSAPSVKLSGSVVSRYRPDGSLTIADFFVTNAPAPDKDTRAAPVARSDATGSKSLKEFIEGVQLEIGSLKLVLAGTNKGDQRFEASSLSGELRVEGGNLLAKFDSKTRIDDREGSIEVNARVGEWLTEAGVVDIASANVDITLSATAVAIPAAGVPVEAERIAIKVKSARLGNAARVDAEVMLRLPDGARSSLTVGLDAENPIDFDKIVARGRVGLAQFPTSVLARFVPAPIDLRRDLGESVDATINVDGRAGSLTLASAQCTAEIAGSFADGAKRLTIDRLSVKTNVDPALLAPSVVLGAPLAVEIKGSLAEIAFGAPTLKGMLGDARGKVEVALAPATVRVDERTIALGATTVVVASARVSDSATVACESVVDGTPVALEATATGVFGQKGSARVAATVGDTKVETTLELSEEGYASAPIHIESLVDPAMAAKYAGDYVRLGAPTQVVMNLAPLSGSWSAIADGKGMPGKLSGSVALSGIVSADWSLDLGEGTGGDLTANADLKIADTDALAAMLVTRAADPVLSGAGSVKASFARRGLTDSFECETRLPRLSANLRGRIVHAAEKSAVAGLVIELAQSSGRFDLPSVHSSLPISDAKGSFDIRSARWSGALGESAFSGRVELDRVRVDLATPGPMTLADTKISLETQRLQEGIKAEFGGNVSLAGKPLSAVALSADLEGDLRGLLGEQGAAVSIQDGRVAFKGSGDQLLSLANHAMGHQSGGSSAPVRLGEIAFVCTARGVSMPQVASGTLAADLSIELAPFTAELAGRPKLSFGKTTVGLKSAAFDREVRLTVDGQLGLGDAAPAPLQLSIDAAGDLSPLIGEGDRELSINTCTATLKIPGELALSAVDFARSNKEASAALERLGAIDARLEIRSLKIPKTGLATASIDASLGIKPLALKVRDQPLIDLGATGLTIKSPALGQSIDVTLATGSPKAGSIEADAHGVGQVDGTGAFAPAAGAWTATARASRMQTALIDSILGEGGRLTEALGPTLDLTIDAKPTPLAGGATGTSLAASLKTATLTLDIPRADIGGGSLSITADAPLQLSFTINDALKKRLLEPINPVLADIRSAPPIKAQVSRLSYPLDGNLANLDADARIEVGDVEVVRSNQVLGILALAQESKDQTIPARIEPLTIMVRRGHLGYSDFIVMAGKFGDQWKQVLKLSGQIDLTKTPPYADAISCRYPLSSLGRTIGGAAGPFSTTAQELSEQIKLLPIDPGELIDVDVTLSGPLGETNGQAATLNSKVKLVFDPSKLDAKKVQKGIEDIGQTIDGFRKLFGK